MSESETTGTFGARHIGPDGPERQTMLAAVGFDSLDALVDAAVPSGIRDAGALDLTPPRSEAEATAELRALAARNTVCTSLIGLGYYGTITPPVIRRNVLENPAWYTAYTPYQPEISQGRLEALVNFQTMVADLAGLDLANASLLDEATAAAEAMTLLHRANPKAGSCSSWTPTCCRRRSTSCARVPNRRSPGDRRRRRRRVERARRRVRCAAAVSGRERRPRRCRGR